MALCAPWAHLPVGLVSMAGPLLGPGSWCQMRTLVAGLVACHLCGGSLGAHAREGLDRGVLCLLWEERGARPGGGQVWCGLHAVRATSPSQVEGGLQKSSHCR